MASLADLVAKSDTVQGVPVYGLSAQGIAVLLSRFPELRAVMVGREVDIDGLFASGGDMICAVIAAGTGNPGNRDEEKLAGRMTAETQAEFVSKILKLTFPNGVGAFVERLGNMLNLSPADEGAQSDTAPATKSLSRSKRS